MVGDGDWVVNTQTISHLSRESVEQRTSFADVPILTTLSSNQSDSNSLPEMPPLFVNVLVEKLPCDLRTAAKW